MPPYSPFTNGNLGNATNLNLRHTEVQSQVESLRTGLSGFTLQSFALPGSALVISNDSITVTQSRHLVDTQGGASSDDLSTINVTTSFIPVLAISCVSSAKVVIVRHNIGNIWLNGKNFTLDDPLKVLYVIWNHTLSKWCMFNPPVQLDTIPTPGTRGFFTWRASQALVTTMLSAAPTVAGTVTESIQSDAAYVNVASSATINSLFGVYILGSLVRRAHNPIIEVLLRTSSDISSQRIWVGLFGASGVANVDTQVAGSGIIGFRYSSAAGDTGWRPVCNDDSGNQTVGTAIGTVSVSTRYKLRLRVDSANGIVYFSVNNSAEVTLNTNLPPVGTNLGSGLAAYNLVAVSRSVLFSRFYAEFD